MGKRVQIDSLILRVYANDHLPPHFHVITPDADALVEIATLEILRGQLPRRAEQTAMTWAAENQPLIAAEWNRINPRFPIA